MGNINSCLFKIVIVKVSSDTSHVPAVVPHLLSVVYEGVV